VFSLVTPLCVIRRLHHIGSGPDLTPDSRVPDLGVVGRSS
jgi:hypothetical protein